MKYDPVPKELFVSNRQKFIKQLKPNSIAIFNSNDEMPKNGDANFDFKQNSDLFWLSGIDQEESILVLFPDCPNPVFKEALFLKKTNEYIAVWEGHKYTQDEARRTSGIQNIFWIDDFEAMIKAVINMAENFYLNLNENDRASNKAPYRDLRFAKEMRERYPLHNFIRAAPIMQRLRSVKSDIEIQLISNAISISNKAFRRLLKFVKPGVMEYEVEAELIHEFIRNKATGHSFSPIIASGKSACVLHYVENNKECKDGDLLLIDSGVDYANYASDLTRTIPVNGRFSKRQKDVYNAVLRVMKAARQLLVPGTFLMEYHKVVGQIMEKELIDLGLLNMKDISSQDPNNPLYKKYFMHGTSHFLGIDVHDVGMRYEPMKAGMVFTCEPGIYIPEEGIGIRIENDILLSDKGPVDLMKDIPVEAEEIEELMNS